MSDNRPRVAQHVDGAADVERARAAAVEWDALSRDLTRLLAAFTV